MGTAASSPDTNDVEEIIIKTGLSRKQIGALWTRFHELDREDAQGCKGYLDADDLNRVPKFNENPIASRLLKVIFDDFGSDGRLNFVQFVEFMSTFAQRTRIERRQRRRSSVQTIISTTKTDLESIKYTPTDSGRSRKMKFIFRMYDVDHDGRLSKEDVQHILKMMVGKISEDEASLIAERVMGEFIEENQPNSTITLENFESTLRTLDFSDKMVLKLLK